MSTFRDILIFHTQSFVIAPAGHNKGSQPFLWLEQTTTNIHRVPLGTQLHIHQMNVIKTNIHGVLIIEPRVFTDARGYFFESFSQREFDEKVALILGHKVTFVQDNESKSSYGVMRGLHFQRPPFTQSKLVRCVKGAVLDVAVDIRKGSPTYDQHVECLLTGRDDEGIRIANELGASVFSAFSLQPSVYSSSSPKASPMVLLSSLRQLSSNTSAMSSIIQRLMEESAS